MYEHKYIPVVRIIAGINYHVSRIKPTTTSNKNSIKIVLVKSLATDLLQRKVWWWWFRG